MPAPTVAHGDERGKGLRGQPRLPDVLSRVRDVVGPHRGGWYEATCPAHPDEKRSLIIKELDGGELLIKCRAGCQPDAVLGALGLTDADDQSLPPVTSGSLPRNPDGFPAELHPRPLFRGDSLEAHVQRGDGHERALAEKNHHDLAVSVTLNAVPHAVYFTLLHVQREASLDSLATTTRFVSRAGAAVLARIAAIEQLDTLWRQRYLAGEEHALEAFVGRQWPGFRGLSAQARYLKASLFFPVYGRLSGLAHATGLSTSTLVLGALVAGLAQSTKWVPDRYLAVFAKGILDFCQYLESRVRLLS